MKAAMLFGPSDLRIVETERPKPARGEVLVKVMAYSPYGTDVGTYLNRDGRYVQQYPIGIGADFSGVVAEIGDDVTNVSIGDRVSALALDHCGDCENCAAGRTNLCLSPDYQVFVRQTACEEYTIVPMRKLARLPDAVSFEDAAMLAGPVDALNAFQKLGLQAGDPVTILGVGAMGLGAIALAHALDLEITAIGGSGKRAELAKEMGASRVFPISKHGEDIAPSVLDASGASAAILETTASQWGIQQAFAIAAPGAAIALTGGQDLPVTAWDLVDRELRVVGVKAGPGQAEILDLIASGKLQLSGAISQRFPFDQANEALALLSGGNAKDIGRVIIEIGL